MSDTYAEGDVASAGEEADSTVARNRELIVAARQRGPFALLLTFTRLSGPGWLQSAITLGGGTLASALYLGVLTGVTMLWWQPVAMLLGIVMLSAIAYVTLSTGQRPFVAINKHVNPVLGWGWAIGSLMANVVWCMPQFSLGTAALRQNLFPDILNREDGLIPENMATIICVIVLFTIGFAVIQAYESKGIGRKIFDWTLKLMVATVVLSFFAVFVKLAMARNFPWAEMGQGFVPSLTPLFNPADVFTNLLAEAGEFGDYWKALILKEQQSLMISAAATAVGINMTFLLPYSMLDRGWDKEFRGMSIFDLLTGLFIPFMVATTCVVVSAATQFHGAADPELVNMFEQDADAAENIVLPPTAMADGSEGDASTPASDPPPQDLVNAYLKLLDARIADEIKGEIDESTLPEGTDLKAAVAVRMAELNENGDIERLRAELPEADRQLAAMLIRRDAGHLAKSLEPVMGKQAAQLLFGVGVLGMAISTIIILMYINGFVICEMLGRPGNTTVHRIGAAIAGLVGATGPFLFVGDAKFYLAVPTSMFGMVLLPVAYITFLSMMNSKSLMGENMPTGGKRIAWNVMMSISTIVATALSLWSISLADSAARTVGYSALGGFLGLSAIVQLIRAGRGTESRTTTN